MTAIWKQESKLLQQEWSMVDLCTKREKYCDDLKSIIKMVKDNRRVADDATMCITFELFLLVRKLTFDLIKAIRGWQKGFTRLRRPNLMEKDYMIDMVTAIDFVNMTTLRKKFNFIIGRGNVFILPIKGNPNAPPPVECSPKLAELVHKFANPSENDLQDGYQALLNSLPPPDYNKVVSAQRWVEATWIPNIIIVENPPPIVVEEVLTARTTDSVSTWAKSVSGNDQDNDSKAQNKTKNKDNNKDSKDTKKITKDSKNNNDNKDKVVVAKPKKVLTRKEKEEKAKREAAAAERKARAEALAKAAYDATDEGKALLEIAQLEIDLKQSRSRLKKWSTPKESVKDRAKAMSFSSESLRNVHLQSRQRIGDEVERKSKESKKARNNKEYIIDLGHPDDW